MSAHEPTPTSAGSAGEAESLIERVTTLNERLHLGDVHIRRLVGEVFVQPPLPIAKIGFHMAAPDVQIRESHFACRFTQRVLLLDDASQHLALVEVVCVLEFRLDDGPEPDSEALSAYAAHDAYYVAHPYIREAIQATTTKLGLDPVILGVLDLREGRPSEIAIRR
jgi:hypothetical protein